MPNDATYEILAGLQEKSEAGLTLIAAPTYNIDDMDPRFCMVNLMFSGMYCLVSTKPLDRSHGGRLLIDGEEAPDGLLIPELMPMFGQIVAIRARIYFRDYDRDYRIRIEELRDLEGKLLEPFEFTIHTLLKHEIGEAFPEHDGIVLQAARESAVLLKNERAALPLGKGAVLNVFGAGAVIYRSGCLGAGKINPRYSIRVREGVEKYSSLKLNEELYDYYTGEENILPPADLLERACEKSGTAVIFISRTSSEAQDNKPEKGYYYLTDEERSLIKGVSDHFDRTVVILNTAYPIETSWMPLVDAVLYVGLPGMAGGRALAEILEGTVNPSGKLACTWAADYTDYPSSKNFLTRADIANSCPDAKFVTTVYEEGLYVGYRYFDTFREGYFEDPKHPAFRFGHGLCYTDFETKTVPCEKALPIPPGKETGASSACRMKVLVKNTGSLPGKEVIMLYAKLPEGRLEQPKRRLVSFAKTRLLKPGESETLELTVGLSALRSFDEKEGAWIIEKGTIEFFLGNAKAGELSVPETILIQKAGGRIPSPVEIRELSRFNSEGSAPTGTMTKAWVAERLPNETKRPYQAAHERKRSAHTAFLEKMTDEELCRLLVGGRTGWGLEDNGFAGMLATDADCLKKYNLPEYYFSDGNNGLNLFEPNIGFPTSGTMAASWNEELLYEEGKAIAEEAIPRGMNCILAPALNLQRNILCGRHTEYFSEDPYLAGRLAGQENRGFEENGVSGCMKHFFANNQELMRNLNHSLMTERAARELYLAAFGFAFEVKEPDTVMTGYNAANGCYCANDPALLQGILRDEMGFTGLVMTDWNGYGDQGPEGLINAGIGFIAPGSPDDSITKPLMEAVKDGRLTRETLLLRAEELLDVVYRHRKEKR